MTRIYPFAIVGLFFSSPVFGHHAVATEFDFRKPVKIKGVVTRMEWTNPHAYVCVEVKYKSGDTAEWIFETAGPLGLSHNGWTRDSVRLGDEVTIFGYRSRSGLKIASARSVLLKDGQKLFAGTPYDGAPKEN